MREELKRIRLVLSRAVEPRSIPERKLPDPGLFYGLGKIGSGRRIILIVGHDNTSERDRIIGVDDGLGDAVAVHECSTGRAKIKENIVSLDGAKLCMIARDARVIDDQIIFQPAPDVDDRLG